MFDSAYKAYTNLKIPGIEEPQKKDTAMAGLLSRTQPMPAKASMEVDDERTRVGRYVAQIRAKREALKNG
jgi:hypothetical protein